MHNNITAMERGISLTQQDQTKITLLFTNFSKSEPGMLKYTEAVMLFLDRHIFCNKFTLIHFYHLFHAALKVKPAKQTDKKEVQGQKIISRQQLIFLFNETAKIIYKPNPNFLEKFYQYLLSQAPREHGAARQNSLQIDDNWKHLITEQAAQKISRYSQELKNIYLAYAVQNYWHIKRKKKLMLTQRQIMLQNKRWSYISLILFLKESDTSPHLTSIEHVEQFLRYLAPANMKQTEFYNKHILPDAYHKQVNGSDGATLASDPGLMLFEFHLLIMRLAWDSYPRDLQRKDVATIIQRYLKYLYLRSNEELSTVPLPQINRKMTSFMKDYYKFVNNETEEAANNRPVQQTTTLYEKLGKKMEKDVMNAAPVDLDFPQIMKVLERQLPKLPLLPVVEKEYLGKYDKAFAITLGQQPPPEPEEKEQKAKAQKKQNKKDQVPLRQFKWADFPTTKLATQDYLKQIQDKLTFQVKPLGDISRGVLSKDGYPVLIGETLIPPQVPKSVVVHIQEYKNACIERNFLLALEKLTEGAAAWRKTAVQFDSIAQLFFQYSRGNVYLSAGKLQYAFNSYYQCRKYSDTSRLPFSNPDRSLPYYGIGQVFYEMQQYELAARAFLKSRQIRESVLGLQHVQTASVFNNLACCFFMLRRSQQALGYIQIAQVVLDTELGSHHQRTMTSRSNLNKITRGTFNNEPAFRKFWQVFEQDKFQKKKKKKKADGQKKKK